MLISSNKDLLFFSKLMLRYEKDIKKKKALGYNIKNKEICKFLKSKAITLDRKTKPYVHCEKNYIVYTSYESACVDLIRHIRNAFAHGQIQIDKNCYLLEDYYKNKLSMYGRINTKYLIELLDLIFEVSK